MTLVGTKVEWFLFMVSGQVIYVGTPTRVLTQIRVTHTKPTKTGSQIHISNSMPPCKRKQALEKGQDAEQAAKNILF